MDSHFGEKCLDLALSLVRPEVYVLTSSKLIYMWDYIKKKIIEIKQLQFPARKIAISDNNDFLAVGCKNGVLEILNPKTLEVRSTFLDQDKKITCLEFSKSSDLLAVGFADGEVRLLSAPLKFRPLVAVVSNHKSRILGLDFSVDNCYLKIVYMPNHVEVIEVTKGVQIDPAKCAIGLIWSSQSTAIGEQVKAIHSFYKNSADITALKLSLGENLLFVGDRFGCVKIFDYPVRSSKQPFKKIIFNSGEIAGISLSEDGSRCFILGK